MSDNYAKIVQENHSRLFGNLPEDFEALLPAEKTDKGYIFKAFGSECTINPQGIFLENVQQEGVLGILLSLYALKASMEPCILEPYKAYKEFPDTMPYVGAFTTHTENILLPHVNTIREKQDLITSKLNGIIPEKPVSGDFSFIVYPLPKLALCYIFYEADEDFPPSVTCLYSNNAASFVPNDALADVGEYTSKKIIALIKNQ